jgi:hypothetical protein
METHPDDSWSDALSDIAWHIRREGLARQQHVQQLRDVHVKHQVVCRYWIANRCMSGNRCVFLHEYRLDKFPLCAYIEAVCPDGAACMFRHEYLPHERRQAPRFDPQRHT